MPQKQGRKRTAGETQPKALSERKKRNSEQKVVEKEDAQRTAPKTVHPKSSTTYNRTMEAFHEYLLTNNLVLKKLSFPKAMTVAEVIEFTKNLTSVEIQNPDEDKKKADMDTVINKLKQASYDMVAPVCSNTKKSLSSLDYVKPFDVHGNPVMSNSEKCVPSTQVYTPVDTANYQFHMQKEGVEQKTNFLEAKHGSIQNNIYNKIVDFISSHEYEAEFYFVDLFIYEKLQQMNKRLYKWHTCENFGDFLNYQIKFFNQKTVSGFLVCCLLHNELTEANLKQISAWCKSCSILLLSTVEQQLIPTFNFLVLLQKCYKNQPSEDVNYFMQTILPDITKLTKDFKLIDEFITCDEVTYVRREYSNITAEHKMYKNLYFNNVISWDNNKIKLTSFARDKLMIEKTCNFHKKQQFSSCGMKFVKSNNTDPSFEYMCSHEFCIALTDCLYYEIRKKKNINEEMVKCETYLLLKLLPNGLESECSIPDSDLIYTNKNFGIIIEIKRTETNSSPKKINNSLLYGANQIQERYVSKFAKLKRQAFLVIDVVGTGGNLRIDYIFGLVYHSTEKDRETTEANNMVQHLWLSQDEICVQFVIKDYVESLNINEIGQHSNYSENKKKEDSPMPSTSFSTK